MRAVTRRSARPGTEPEDGGEFGNRFVRDVLSVLTSNVFILVVRFLSSVLLARLLGPSGRGTLAAVLVIPTLITSFSTLGVKQAAVYYIGKQRIALDQLISTILLLVLIAGPISMAIAGAGYWLQGTEGYGGDLVLLALLPIPLVLLADYVRGVALGCGEIRYYNRINYIVAPLNLAFLLVLVGGLKLGVQGALATYLLSGLLAAIYGLVYLRGRAPLAVRYVRGLPWQVIRIGVVYSLASLALSLNYRVDIFLLDRMVTPAEVGLYAMAVTFAELIWKIPAQMGPVLFSRSANTTNDGGFSRGVAALVRLSLWFCSLLGLGFYVAAPAVIELVYGDEFLASVASYRILIPGIVFGVVFNLLHTDLAGKGRPLLSVVVFLPAAALNVALNYAWVPAYGISGAATATTVSYTAGAVAYAVVYSRVCGLPLRDLFLLKRTDLVQVRRRIGQLLAKSSLAAALTLRGKPAGTGG